MKPQQHLIGKKEALCLRNSVRVYKSLNIKATEFYKSI